MQYLCTRLSLSCIEDNFLVTIIFIIHRALKNAITGLLAGETMPRVLMTVIR